MNIKINRNTFSLSSFSLLLFPRYLKNIEKLAFSRKRRVYESALILSGISLSKAQFLIKSDRV